MSPLRRIGLAWVSFWPIPLALGSQAIILAGLVNAVVRQDRKAADLVQVHPALGFLLVPLFIGMHLKQLTGIADPAIAEAHDAWQRRFVLLVLLPANAILVATALLLIGVPPLPAAVSAIVPTLLGTWMGYAQRMAPFLCAWALWCGAYLADHLGAPPRSLHLLELATAGIGFAIAWNLRGRAPSPTLIGSRSGGAWYDLLVPTVGFRPCCGLPGLGTVTRSWFDGLTARGALLIATAAVLTGTAALLIPASGDDLVPPLVITCMLPAYAAAFRYRAFHRDAGGTDRLHLRAALASDRLLPFPRRQAAAISVLSPVVSSLGVTAPLAIGATAGLLLAHGAAPAAAWSARAWLILPAVAAFSLALIAALILFQILHRWSLAAFWLLLVGAFLGWSALAAGQSLSDWQMMGVAGGAALVLAFAAWHRLAAADLP